MGRIVPWDYQHQQDHNCMLRMRRKCTAGKEIYYPKRRHIDETMLRSALYDGARLDLLPFRPLNSQLRNRHHKYSTIINSESSNYSVIVTPKDSEDTPASEIYGKDTQR